MLLDHHGRPLTPAWFAPNATRLDALHTLRAQASSRAEASTEAALYYADWLLARHLLEARLAVEPCSAELLATLGLVLLRLGEHEAARAACLRAQLLAPDQPNASRLAWELGALAEQRRRLPELPPELLQCERVRLEPLGVQHWEDVVWQYADPAIQAWCRWPKLGCFADFQRFLANEDALGDVLVFAVQEADFGFCGAVSLVLHARVGFLSYWLGQEFRGRGLAAEAARGVLRLAQERWGMHACYATVLDENHASRRLLARLGFVDLGVEPLPPFSSERVYRRGAPVSASAAFGEAVQLFGAMGSLVQLALPVAA